MSFIIKREFTNYFVEDDTVVTITPRNSSSIDTTITDPHRQGVELQRQIHYDRGVVKIHSGEIRHIVRQSEVGMSKFLTNVYFKDLNRFDPVQYINERVVVDVDDNNIAMTDGAFEPLMIRTQTQHSFKGALQQGNEENNGSDLLQWVFEKNANSTSFLDSSLSITVFITPFDDIRLIRDELVNEQDSTILHVLSQMTGNVGYISYKEKSSTSGFVFSNNSKGTDSIAFGD